MALPGFREVMLRVYGDKIAGPPPSFPAQMEQRITSYLQGDAPVVVEDRVASVSAASATRRQVSPGETDWLLHHGSQ